MCRTLRVVRTLFGSFTLAALLAPGAVSAADGVRYPVALSAVVVTGAEPLADVEFTVTSIDSTAPVQVRALSDKGPTTVEVPPGRYKVLASYGHTTTETEITVEGKASSHQLTLNAGTVLLKLIKNVGGPMIKTGLGWEVLTYGKDAEGKRHLIATSQDAQPRFVLPEGYYLVRAVNGTQDVKHTIEVTNGVTYKYTVILQ